MDQIELHKATPEKLRLKHARYFAERYRSYSGPPRDKYWLMVGYFDAFLFLLVSISEMASQPVRDKLLDLEAFRFFKTLRNIATHHSVLTVTLPNAKYERPFGRLSGAGSASFERLFFKFDALRELFCQFLREQTNQATNVKKALTYLDRLESRGETVYLDTVMFEIIDEVEAHL